MRREGLIALACVLLAAPTAFAATTTKSHTIVDSDRDNRLEPGPGEDHVARTDLGAPRSTANRRSLAFFGQFTDKHVVDEESPLRVEFTDQFGLIFTSAYRPQEGISPQVIDSMVDQIRNVNSPTSGRRIEFLMTTGDNTDNTQCNETRWMIDLLDGDRTVDPNSGVPAGTRFADEELCITPGASPPAVQATAPDCGVDPAGLYEGVRGDGDYYEPDSSDGEDGRGYSPHQAENEAEAQRSSSVRDFPGLFEAMNQPFEATGLDIPWYGIFGNHDGLIQGNQPRNPGFEALATSCAKIIGLSGEDEQEVRDSVSEPQAMADLLAAMQESAGSGDVMVARSASADPRRRPLRKNEYIAEHFRTGGLPVGHGFPERNLATGEGNYSFNPKPGLRFIVLDTVAEHGLEEGNLDDAQFRWLHEELVKAEGAKELAVVFAHHSLRTMGQPPVSPFLPGDTGGNLSPLVHFGEGPRQSGQQLPCLLSSPALPPYPTETLRCLLLRHDNAIAFVNGHEHANRVTPYRRDTGGGFWEINTASHIDWPQQSRVLEIFDNRDGTLTQKGTVSIVSTILDHDASANPGDGDGYNVDRLSSISRELSYNDPHANNGEDGHGDSRGSREDRNVVLTVPDPR